MYQQTKDQSHLWSIILAGGEGTRLSPVIQQWLGYHKPKQYCAFIGTRSMLQHTLDRADRLTPPERKVTVIAPAHREYAQSQLGDRPGSVIQQPANCDTAAGVFLPLTYVRAYDPNAVVVVYPSDHFIYPEEEFVRAVRHAALSVDLLKNQVVLLGVRPDGVEPEYGWIFPGQEIGWYGNHRLRSVDQFIEKPVPADARAALAAGALWNTLVLTARVETLWNLGWRYLPEMMPLFDKLEVAIGTPEEDVILESIYRVMPTRNFSRDLLQRAPHHAAAIELSGVLWSDWGRPERITEILDRLGKEPAFAPAYQKVG